MLNIYHIIEYRFIISLNIQNATNKIIKPLKYKYYTLEVLLFIDYQKSNTLPTYFHLINYLIFFYN